MNQFREKSVFSGFYIGSSVFVSKKVKTATVIIPDKYTALTVCIQCPTCLIYCPYVSPTLSPRYKEVADINLTVTLQETTMIFRKF